MNKFDVEYTFLIPEGDLHAEVMEMFAQMSGLIGPDEPTEYDNAESLVEALFVEVPFAVRVDGDDWATVDRNSADRYIVLVTLNQATVTDDVLESLPDPEDRLDAAVWTIMNNEWDAKLMTLEEYDARV